MSKKAKIVIISVVCAVVVLTIILSVSLTVGSFNNRFIRQMTKLNYSVGDYTSAFHNYSANGNSYYTAIEAYRTGRTEENDDYVEVYIFKNKDDATKFYGEQMANRREGERVVQKGKKVYVGTDQGIIDLGI